MRFLIVEDDFTSRKYFQKMLAPYGECDLAVNGQEAVEAFVQALSEDRPYDLITMDIMMPVMDGQEALKLIRQAERTRGIKDAGETRVIMTTALDDPRNVVEAYYRGGATSYLTKPVDRSQFLSLLQNLGIISEYD